ncbi:hypothetical protein RUM44_007969 [Polyplax serrata]|uniref:Uncharacterized protein n=1 Tax=Polyplax serrata TaxID=468196 RepID=A0ABR1BB40_POLSC
MKYLLILLIALSTTSNTSSSTQDSRGGEVANTWLDGFNSPLIQDQGDNKMLKLRFDVSQYQPEEIVVKTVDNKLLASPLEVNATFEITSLTAIIFYISLYFYSRPINVTDRSSHQPNLPRGKQTIFKLLGDKIVGSQVQYFNISMNCETLKGSLWEAASKNFHGRK